VFQFSKVQGLGNDFVLIDGRDPRSGPDADGFVPERVRHLCDRRFGIGADGLILALPPREGGEVRMRIFNADGSEPEMCGNGIRCLARFLAERDGDPPGRRWQVETLAGRIVPELLVDGTVRVDMGPPLLEPAAVPTTLPVGPYGLPQGEVTAGGRIFAAAAAGMGNPHLVVPVEDVEAVDLEVLGPSLEGHEAFPARTNVHFVQVLAPDHLRLRVWERGAGPTLACGTGACATLVACHRLGLCRREARVDLPGGSLHVSWSGSDGHVWMTGPAEPVFDGTPAPALWQDPAPRRAGAAAAEAKAVAVAEAEIDCSIACVNGCVRPEACASAEARARVEALLSGRSLDELVDLAAQSTEARIRSRSGRGDDLGC
jgi:diaminopimelate epimerase